MTKRRLNQVDLSKRDGRIFVRCPVNLKAAVIRSAERSARSVAAEVTLRLLRSLEDYEFIPNLSESGIES